MKRSVTIKAAKIGGACVIVAAIITGFFSLYGSSETTSINTRTEQVQHGEGPQQQIGQLEVEQQGDNSMIFTGPVQQRFIISAPASPTGEIANLLKDKTRDKEQEDKIELIREDIDKLIKALEDLDQRTSGIEKLPDGRSKIGSIITGKPYIVIEGHNQAVKFLHKNDFSTAFQHSKHAIEAFELSLKVESSIKSVYLDTPKIAKLYFVGAWSANRIKEHPLALQWAEKANKTEPNLERLLLFAITLYNVNEPDKALETISQGLTKYPDNKALSSLKQNITAKMGITP